MELMKPKWVLELKKENGIVWHRIATYDNEGEALDGYYEEVYNQSRGWYPDGMMVRVRKIGGRGKKWTRESR